MRCQAGLTEEKGIAVSPVVSKEARKSSRLQSPNSWVVLMPWPSNSHELEAQLGVPAGDWCSRESLLYCGPGTSLGASALQSIHRTGKLKLQMVPFP